MYYTTNPNGAIRYSSNDKALLQLQDPGFNMQETDKNIITAWDGQLYIEGSEPVQPDPSPEELESQFSMTVTARLNEFAALKQYDSIQNAMLMLESEAFKNDGIAAYAAYDATWPAALDLIPQVTRGALSIEDALAQLPQLQWPED